MFSDFILPVIIVLFFCYFLFPKFQHGVDVQINHTKFLLSNITNNNNNNNYNYSLSNKALSKSKQRTDYCMASHKEECPIGRYTQCTNNYLNHARCDCTDQRSFEVCSKNEPDTEGIDSIFKATSVYSHNNNTNSTDNIDATRVNLYTVSNSEYNDPGKLKLGRTNPYVL